MSSFQQKRQNIQKNKEVWPIHSKEVNQQTTLEKGQLAHLLDKDFKTTILKMLKELKEDVEKVKKMIQQNGNINKEKENLKRNQKEILELKSKITEMKKEIDNLNTEQWK